MNAQRRAQTPTFRRNRSTGKSHTPIGLGMAAVHARTQGRYFAALDLIAPSTAGRPTTPSARSSTPGCAAIRSSSNMGSHPG